jgi:hypothetical protein
MKTLLLFFFCFGFVAASEPCRYSAVLALPATLSSSSLSTVPMEVTVRWVCDQPLLVRVWGKEGYVGQKVGGDSIREFPKFFTESGEEVKCWEPLAQYLPYDAVRKLVGDQELKLKLQIWGSAEFKSPGRYYAVLEFYAEREDGNLVRLKTEKCWFTFVEEEKKKPNRVAGSD